MNWICSISCYRPFLAIQDVKAAYYPKSSKLGGITPKLKQLWWCCFFRRFAPTYPIHIVVKFETLTLIFALGKRLDLQRYICEKFHIFVQTYFQILSSNYLSPWWHIRVPYTQLKHLSCNFIINACTLRSSEPSAQDDEHLMPKKWIDSLLEKSDLPCLGLSRAEGNIVGLAKRDEYQLKMVEKKSFQTFIQTSD